MHGSSALPRRQRGITIKMIIVLEVASLVRDRKEEKRDERKGNDMPFSASRHGRTCARVLVLIAAVNASNFTRLISLSLAEAGPVPEARMDGRKEKKKQRNEQRDDNFAIQTPRLIGLPSPLRFCAPLSRPGRSARRLIKFSGNQICHSAVRF